MFVFLLIGIGIPGLILSLYVYGRIVYGERWYLALGKNSTWGADDPVAQEIDEMQFTRLHLNNAPREKNGSSSRDSS